jgi:hypothetical protein
VTLKPEVKNKKRGAMINRRNLLLGIPAAALMAHQAGHVLAQGATAGA